jgi:DNA polymerase-3 subunit alpha (Gram-positive type)
MNDLWMKPIRAEAPDLLELLQLDKVLISRSGTGLTLCLNASRLLTEPEYNRLDRVLSKAVPGYTAKVEVAYPALREEVLRDVTTVSDFLARQLIRRIPGAAPMLRHGALWRIEKGKLYVPVPGALGAHYLKRQDLAKLTEMLMHSLFGLELTAVLEVRADIEKTLESIEADRAVEEQIFARRDAEVQRQTRVQKASADSGGLFGKPFNETEIPMDELGEETGRCAVKGELISSEVRDIRGGACKVVTFVLSDRTNSVNCKLFLGGKRGKDDPALARKLYEKLEPGLKKGSWLKVRGDNRYDEYENEMCIRVTDVMQTAAPVRVDAAEAKRVELHLHTQMSAMDACASPTALIRQAAKWGHKAIAITDHGVVQAFPEAFAAAEEAGIKLIPGCEGYLIDDRALIVERADGRSLKEAAYVVLDVETTGLNPRTDAIIELGAVRFEGGQEVASFSRLIDPGRLVPDKVAELTGITNAMLHGQPTLPEVIREFHELCRDAVVCAHNAPFDWAFVSRAFGEAGLPHDHPVLDTLPLARNLLKGQKSHRLPAVCKTLGISLKEAHRAVHDARATAQALMILLERTEGAATLSDLNNAFDGGAGSSHHIILLAKTQQGLADLYRLVSEGHLNHFHRTPRLPRSLIQRYREGLILGSACESGELFKAVLEGRSKKELKKIASFYDYLEVQPLGNNEFLVREGKVDGPKALMEANKRIIELGRELGKPVVATGDVHFMDPQDAIYRAILMNAKGFDDADHQPPLYFRTTDEMLREFDYLPDETARELVIGATNRIADMVSDDLTIFVQHPKGKKTFQPYWPEAEENIRRLTMDKATRTYGDPLPDVVQKRVNRELETIINSEFSTLYDIAVKLVTRSLEEGYIVGSRGSVGSSFVAWATGITEVNALPPHYVCPGCQHSEFDVDEERFACGLDLPDKDCPVCGARMDRDGFNIPFEVFLDVEGKKVPDIDLNFSGEYQARAHNYVKELFGAENVFRAGTIGTVAEKTAFGYVLKYLEERGLTASQAEKTRLALGCTGVKRTTGQHPAGMVVLPEGYEIYQFTPIQRPADDQKSQTVTTHFEFSSMHDVLVKLDILGHDDPTMLKKLQDLTGIAPRDVPLHDKEVFDRILSLFRGPEALGVTPREIGAPTGTLGIPEFGTRFVRQMLVDTRPSTVEEIVRISGLSHGTDVWLGNAQEIIKQGTAPLRKCICTRDDIMNQLIAWGVESKMAFAIMESVRKGNGLKPAMEEAMREVDTPEWFIDSCKKIKYMFPKAHAVAYVMMALRIAYFKVYYPTQYYACYLMRNVGSFDALTMIGGAQVLRSRLEEYQNLERAEKARKEDAIALLEVLVEMRCRGIAVLPIDLYRSHQSDFLVVGEREILSPFIALPGLGMSAAENLAKIRDQGPFISKDDMRRRGVTPSIIEMLEQAGAVADLPETSQVSLFDLE